MSASAQMTEEMIVSNTVNIQSAKPAPWWQGLTLDQQDEWLDRIDPEQYGPGKQAPMSVSRWNREKKRIRRARERWIQEIAVLRRACRCKFCRRHRRPPFPKYYVVNRISYECWLEEQTIDPELEDDLAQLRNDRPRLGSTVIGRRPPDDGIFRRSI